MSSLRYRGDIDGLRALAVLGVVIYHAFPWALPGGFSGVDIFFVISGYLISGILYKGHRDRNFSYREFYARRIRRLFPALITVLLLCLAYGWLVLLPDEYEQLGKHVSAGTVFAQNFVFWKESGYFDKAAELKPLLHLWSLAVEEQFYIVFPLLLVLLWKKPRILLPSMIILLIASFVGNMVMSLQSPETDFYLTPYRGWEFLGGSLLAWWHYDRGHEEEVPRYREALSWVGALLLGLGMGLLEKHQPYPGWRAILPVAGTLLLMEGGKGAWVNRKILSHPAVVWVGLISYPLYLFHWPALSFVHIVKGEKAPAAMIWAALGVALLLTLLTYYFIEKRIRHHKSLKTVPLLVTAFLLTGILGSLAWADIVKARSHRLHLDDAIAASREESTPPGLEMQRPMRHVTLYRMGKGEGARTLFVGDSNMEMYAPRIQRIVSCNAVDGRAALMLWSGGVPPIPGIAEDQRPGSKELLPTMDRLLEKDPKIDRVVLGADWVLYCSLKLPNVYHINGHAFPSPEAQEDAIRAMADMIRSLRKRGREVYVVLNIPIAPSQEPKNEVERDFLEVRSHPPEALSTKAFDADYGKFLDAFAKGLAASGSIVIDPLPFFGRDGIYPRIIDGQHLYKDGGHLRASFVRDHVTYLDETLRP